MKVSESLAKVVTLSSLICSSYSAFTGISFRPTDEIVTVDDEFVSTPVFELGEGKGIAYDSVSSTYYALIGETAGSQQLLEICDSQTTVLFDLKPNNVLLECLSYGPRGLYAINAANPDAKTFGKISNFGKYKKVGELKGPYDTMILAQNPSGIFHYINGQGKFYTNPGKDKEFTRDPTINFPQGSNCVCGDYLGKDIIAAPTDPVGGIGTFSFSSPTSVTIESVTPKYRFADVTGGKMGLCDGRGFYTGVRNKVTQINADDLTVSRFFREDGMVGFTNDAKTEKSYAIIGTGAGNQTLAEVTQTTAIPIADIPSAVDLTCLTSGPTGMFAVDDLTGTIGKLKKNSGKFVRLASLPGPYDTKVIASDSSGVLHYINGAGSLYTNPGKVSFFSRDPSTTFPTGTNGLCGDFDSTGDIISALNEDTGGYNVYSFNSPTTVTTNILSPRTRINDISNGNPPL